MYVGKRIRETDNQLIIYMDVEMTVKVVLAKQTVNTISAKRVWWQNNNYALKESSSFLFSE